jgi:hypothetical protein
MCFWSNSRADPVIDNHQKQGWKYCWARDQRTISDGWYFICQTVLPCLRKRTYRQAVFCEMRWRSGLGRRHRYQDKDGNVINQRSN